jgi:diguanylate cyclase
MNYSNKEVQMFNLTFDALSQASDFAPLDGSHSEQGEAPPVISNLTVLMIDDEPMLTDVIQAYLEDAGYTHLVAVNDPTVALETARRCKPSLVLLDLMMPKVSGFDILEQLRRDDELRYVPVIVLTAASDPATKLRALDLGATEFLAKPVDASELVLRVRNSLALKVYQDRLANSDPLTGLPNRRAFVDRSNASIEHARVLGSRLSLLHVKLDRFHQVSALLGPAASEQMLSRVARRLVGCVRRDHDDLRENRLETVMVSRLGSEAFVILLPHIDAPEVAELVARRVLEAMARPFRLGGNGVGNDDVVNNPSIGISMFPEDGASADDLMGYAASAAEHAQSAGRNTWRFYSKEFNQISIERIKIEAQLRRAIERKELSVVYQPKVDRHSGLIMAAEALLRWKHPEMGNIAPDRFIPIAEETGLICDIGAFVVDQACAELARWRTCGLGHVKVAVNLSRQELVSEHLVRDIRNVMKRHHIERGQLVLELTEGTLIDRIGPASLQLKQLRELGVEISIDDFGTGYSSMTYVKHFPLDELKIDRSFVQGLPDDKADLAIVHAITVLGHSLGMRVVAEGIETTAQLEAVQALGIDQFQGYLLGKPLPPDQFEALAKSFELSMNPEHTVPAELMAK